VPLGTGEEAFGTVTGGANLFVFDRGSEEEQKAAFEWVEFLSSAEIQADWGIETGYLAANKNAWETEKLMEYTEQVPEYAFAREGLEKYAEPSSQTYQSTDIDNTETDAVQAFITGESSPAEALQRAQNIADSILEQYR